MASTSFSLCNSIQFVWGISQCWLFGWQTGSANPGPGRLPSRKKKVQLVAVTFSHYPPLPLLRTHTNTNTHKIYVVLWEAINVINLAGKSFVIERPGISKLVGYNSAENWPSRFIYK